MPIESGKRYIITNGQSKTVVDLDINDKQKVQCWTEHQGPNQQWEFHQPEEANGAWLIQNVGNPDVYLGFEGDDTWDGKKVEGHPQRRLWHIWQEEGIPNAYRIYVPDTQLNIDLESGNVADGTLVQLWTKWQPGLNQVWSAKEV